MDCMKILVDSESKRVHLKGKWKKGEFECDNLFMVSGMTNAEVLHQVEHGYRMLCPQGCPPNLYEIMLECWNKDPMARPTFETLHWKLDDFYMISDSEYRDATAY